MSKSAGQWIGTAVGAVAGFFLPGGYVALGASIGGMVGGMIDPPKGPSVTGPRLEDQSFTSSTLGAALARGYGTFPVSGNVIWLEGDKYREVTTTESQGGKGGGGGSEVTSYTYYATFAVSLLRVTDPTKTVSLRRLWVGSNLVYDAGSGNLESVIASNSGEGVNFTFYNGSDTQQPNPRWQADKGVNAVSGFPGRCYIVIEDLELTKYSNSLAMAQIKAELTIGSVTNEVDFIETLGGSWGNAAGRQMSSVVFQGVNSFQYAVANYDSWSQNPTAVEVRTNELMINDAGAVGESLASFGYNAPHMLYVCSSDRPAMVTIQGYDDSYGHVYTRIRIHDASGTVESPTQIHYADFYYAPYSACLDGGDLFLFRPGGQIALFSGGELALKSASTYTVNKGGLSENYLFVVLDTGYPQSATTVYKFSRTTLDLISTYTQSVPGTWAAIHVVSDNEFFTMAEGHVYRWFDGVAADVGALANFGAGDSVVRTWFTVSATSPYTVISIVCRSSFGIPKVYIGHGVVNAGTDKLRDLVTAECGLAGIAAADLDLTALVDDDVRGDRITERGSVRAALEPLQARFQFDVAHSGYKLRFVSRGGASLATIPESDLGAVAGSEKSAVLLTVAREMDTQLPRKVSVKYLDVDREYDLGEQYAERPAPNSVNERVLDLPLVMNSGEGAQTADVLLSKEWVERVDFGPFSLPPTWRHLEAADIVTVEHRGQSHTVRLTRVEYLPDGRITCNAKLTAAQSYTSTATGEAPAVLGQSLVPLRGSTTAYLLDIPRIRAEQDVPGLPFGLLGRASGWPGGALLRSDDQGTTWTSVGAMNSSARVFIASNTLSAHHGYSIDHAAVLTVTPETPGAELYSVTEEQLYSQANIAAYGVDGRWEIVSFRSVTDNTGTYTLKDFLRGLYGTEWATGLHAAGDLMIMLDTSTVGFFGLPTTAIGSERQYKAVTRGQAIDAAATAKDTYGAINLKPIAPVDASGTVLSKQWTITASRRTRMPVEVFSGATVPLGESAESYDLELYDASFSTLKRTFSGLTSMSATYTEAQQIADFGAAVTMIYGRWYQNSAVVGRGFPLQFSLTRNPANDPYADFVRLGMHFDGTDGSTTFTDVKGHTFTVSGTAKIATAQSKFGGASGIFGGSTGYIYTTEAIGNQDFCLECWGYFPSNADGGYKFPIMQFGVNLDGTDGWLLARNGNDGALWVHNTYSNIIGKACPSSAWVHVAVFRSGSSMYLAVDGSVSNALGSLPNMASTTRLTIGTASLSWSQDRSFYLDEMRLVVGASVYSPSGFTPPTDAFYF